MHCALLLALAAAGQVAAANVRPQIGYVFPPAGRAGTTVEVRLGTYDWTPDMELLVHDRRVQLEQTGPLGEPILTPPPYWFGLKAGQVQPPLPREAPARFMIPADMPPGVVPWQAANANGGTEVGSFVVSDLNEAVEPEASATAPFDLPALPCAVSGRVSRIAEVDQYRFTAPTSGLVVCELNDRLGQPFRAVLTIRDASGAVVADCADTTGAGGLALFVAQQGQTYTAALHDAEFGGDRAFVYRLAIRRGPHVVASLPLALARGETRPVEFVGWGLATGKRALESVTRPVAVPADAAGESFLFRFDTPAGPAQAQLALAAAGDALEPAAEEPAARRIAATAQISAALDKLDPASQMPQDVYQFEAVKGTALLFRALAADYGSPVDPTLVIIGPDGKELGRNDDQPAAPPAPGSTDAQLAFTAPADGVYELRVIDLSGNEPTRAGVYRLLVENQAEAFDFALHVANKLDLPIGGTADLLVKTARRGTWQEPIELSLEGLPPGVSVPMEPPPPPEPVDPKAKKKPAPKKPAPGDIKLSLVCAADAPARAALAMVVAKATVGERTIERRVGPVLVSTTLKTRCKVKSAVQDGGRIVNRGATYPADVLVERLEDYTGPVTLQMAATQQRQRRGIRGGTLVVPAGVDAVQYPIFMPEWLETSLTARMNVIGVVEVPDPQGNVRHVTGVMDGFVVMSLEGALLKVSHEPEERTAVCGGELEIAVRVSRSARLPAAAQLELVAEGPLAGLIAAEPVAVPASASSAVVKLKLADDARLVGEQQVRIRATARQDGKWPCVSETTIPVLIEPARSAAAR